MLKSEDIVDALIQLRDRRHLTTYKIALKSDLPTSTVTNVFQKRTMPQLDTLLAICRGLEINPAQLFTDIAKFDKLTDDEIEILNFGMDLTLKGKNYLKNLYICYNLNT